MATNFPIVETNLYVGGPVGPIRVNCVFPGRVDTPWWHHMDETSCREPFDRTAATLPGRSDRQTRGHCPADYSVLVERRHHRERRAGGWRQPPGFIGPRPDGRQRLPTQWLTLASRDPAMWARRSSRHLYKLTKYRIPTAGADCCRSAALWRTHLPPRRPDPARSRHGSTGSY